MNELTHYIGGKHVNGQSGRFADVMNPATGEVQAKVPLASSDELAQAVESRPRRRSHWGATNPQKRAGC
jgi:malonate-semialdehyde dehydrogenase (acetylating)/methylmalonate-semialdehyde dehydrogenase